MTHVFVFGFRYVKTADRSHSPIGLRGRWRYGFCSLHPSFSPPAYPFAFVLCYLCELKKQHLERYNWKDRQAKWESKGSAESKIWAGAGGKLQTLIQIPSQTLCQTKPFTLNKATYIVVALSFSYYRYKRRSLLIAGTMQIDIYSQNFKQIILTQRHTNVNYSRRVTLASPTWNSQMG